MCKGLGIRVDPNIAPNKICPETATGLEEGYTFILSSSDLLMSSANPTFTQTLCDCGSFDSSFLLEHYYCCVKPFTFLWLLAPASFAALLDELRPNIFRAFYPFGTLFHV